MRKSLPPRPFVVASFGALLGLLLASPLALAHEDDPKILDRVPRYEGSGFRGASLAAPSGFGGAPGVGTQAGTAFASQGVTLLSWLTLPDFGTGASSGNDCWGYVSASGREYALMGLETGLAVVEISAPSSPVIVEHVPGPISLWRDVKVYQQYAYVVSEGGDGIQVVDLGQVDAGVVKLVNTVTFGGDTTTTHNVVIDEVSGYLYRAGGGENGLRIYSLANPVAPQFVSSWPTRYVHDAQAVTYTEGPWAGREIVFAAGGFNSGYTETGVDILDVTDKQNIVQLSRFFYPGPAYSHQCWLSTDRKHLYVNDELDEDGLVPTTTIVLDVEDLTAPSLAGMFTNGNTAIGHNLYTKGSRIYEANYRSGLRVFDGADDPAHPVEVAWFDTWASDDDPEFNGLWSVYPYFPSGVVIGSDLERGLFVLWVDEDPLDVQVVGGPPSLVDPGGELVPVTIAGVDGASYQPGTGRLHWNAGSGWQSQALVDLGGGDFEAPFPALACGAEFEYYLTADTTGGITVKIPVGLNGETYRTAAAPAESLVVAYDMDSSAGWTSGASGDDASTGQWVRGEPLGTNSQPEYDHGGAGGDCWFTGQGSPGGSVGDNDVDGGVTTLVSPTLDLSNTVEPVISYWRWFSNQGGSVDFEDVLEVEISNDGGGQWQTVETVGPDGSDVIGGWLRHSFRVEDHVAPTHQVQVRFRVGDLFNGSIVEAAIDDFRVDERVCPDCDESGSSDELEILAGTLLDLNGDGLADPCQPLSADLASVSLFLGGTQSLTLDAGADFAGGLYLLLGSASGAAPGLVLGDQTLPLVADGYFTFTLTSPGVPPLVGALGILDGQGTASAAFALPPGASGTLAGLTLNHAYLVLSLSGGTLELASNAIPVQLLP